MKILIIGIFLFYQLIGINSESKISHSQTCEDSIKVFLADWKSDSLGCLNLRTFQKARFLIQKLELNKKSAKDIIRLLGPPNKGTNFDTSLLYVYYFSMVCPDGVLTDSTEGCWIIFRFNPVDSMVVGIQAPCI